MGPAFQCQYRGVVLCISEQLRALARTWIEVWRVHVQRAVRMLVARVEFRWLRLLESGLDAPCMHPAAWQRALVRHLTGCKVLPAVGCLGQAKRRQGPR